MKRFFLFIWCEITDHQWQQVPLPENRRIKQFRHCSRCGTNDIELV